MHRTSTRLTLPNGASAITATATLSTCRKRGAKSGAANVFYALGEEAGLGFSPFGIEDEENAKGDLAASYTVLESLSPLIAEHQAAGTIHGFVLDKEHSSVDFTMSGYTVHVTLDELFGGHADSGFGLIIAAAPDEFLGAGKGFKVTFTPRASAGQRVGIAAVEEGSLKRASGLRGGV